MLWLIFATLLAYVFYKLWKLKNFWKDRNIPSKEPAWFFGDILENIQKKKSFIEILSEVYNAFPDYRYVGFSQANSPMLVIRDPELIKQICIKDFDNFNEHRSFGTDVGIDPLWDKNLFAAKGPKWKELRPLLSPTFTSSKMKLMFTLMNESAQRFVQYFKNQDKSAVEVELKDTSSRFTNDVIATTAFGIECDSLKNRTNEFYLMGKSITGAFTGLKSLLRFFGFNFFPNIMKLLGVTVFPKKSATFFVNVIDTTIREREQKQIMRPDLMNLLLEARSSGTTLKHEEQNGMTEAGFATVEESSFGKDEKNKKKTLSDDDIYAQCLIFFFAGFDTVSNAMTLTLYELALNTDIQSKLRKEVDEVWKDCNGILNYEAYNGNEIPGHGCFSLRKWTPAPFTDRRCVKRYVIPPVRPNEKLVEIEPGQVISIPIHCIHMDEKYFPEPQRFDPERFSDENKHNIKPGTYNPFGVGPRNCIGSRFALLELKTLIFHILRNFEVAPNKKTQIPLVSSKTSFNFVGENGTWVDFVMRLSNEL